MITIKQICDIFKVSLKNNQPGIYEPVIKNTILYLPYDRLNVYSYINYSKIRKSISNLQEINVEPVIMDPHVGNIQAVYYADRLIIRPTKNGNFFYLSNHVHRCYQFWIYDESSNENKDLLRYIYRNYEECLQYCTAYNIQFPHRIPRWASTAKLVFNENIKLIKLLQYYNDYYNQGNDHDRTYYIL